MEDQNPDFGKTDRSDANSGQSFGKINRIHENSIPRFGKTSQIHENSIPRFGKTSQIHENSIPRFGKTSQIHENSIPRFGKTSQIHENLIPSHVLTTEIRRTQRLHTKFGDMKLIRCNKPSLRDLSADDVCRKLKNVTNLMEQKSRRDDTSVENTYSTSLNPVGMKYRYIREYCDDNLRITDMSSLRDSMKVRSVFYRCVVLTGLLYHYKIDDIELKHTVNNVSSLRDLSADDVCRKLKHNVTNLMVQKSRRDDTSVENTYSTSLNPVGMKYRYIREYCDDNLRITDMSSRRDDTLLTVCFSLRTDDVSKMCRQICRKICYTLLISHPLVRILSVFSFPLRLKYVSLL